MNKQSAFSSYLLGHDARLQTIFPVGCYRAKALQRLIDRVSRSTDQIHRSEVSTLRSVVARDCVVSLRLAHAPVPVIQVATSTSAIGADQVVEVLAFEVAEAGRLPVRELLDARLRSIAHIQRVPNEADIEAIAPFEQTPAATLTVQAAIIVAFVRGHARLVE